MSDAQNLAARREARRRRILESSESRLKKIADLPGSVNITELSTAELNLPKGVIDDESQNVVVPDETSQQKCEGNILDNNEHETTPLPSDWATLPPSPSAPLPAILRSHIIQIIILALVVFILRHFKLEYLVYHNAFIPFFTLELAQFVVDRNFAPSGMFGLAVTILGMYGISNKVLTSIFALLALVMKCTRDLFLYVFVLCICWTVCYY